MTDTMTNNSEAPHSDAPGGGEREPYAPRYDDVYREGMAGLNIVWRHAMSNVLQILGITPKPDRLIKDMEPGETGYAVTWAYNAETGQLDENFTIIKEKMGTASLYVECVEPGKYVIEFEEPRYRNIFTGEWE